MKHLISSDQLVELSSKEASAITGGESLWYWLFYTIGSVPRMWNEGMAAQKQAIMQSGVSGRYAAVL